MFLDHRTRRPVRRLEWRIRLLGVGAILALVGLYFEASWMIWVAIGVLVLGVLLRLLPGSEAGREPSDDEEER
jgi:hypothetical protein